jgi:3-hydroxybutyrate dehydrogenase
VTGSLQGLGLAAARGFAAAGCHVALSGLDTAGTADALRRSLESEHGVRVVYSDADLRVPSQIARMITESETILGGIDILVNNAVVRHAAPIEEFGVDQWDDAIAVNLSAAFHTTRLVVPTMKRRQWGRIINVSSIYGRRGAANRVGYVTTKTALLGMTRAVALETVQHGITCNAICPGTTGTPVHEAAIERLMESSGVSRTDAERTFFAGRQPSGRFIRAESVAALIVFLCGPDGDDITGAELPIDGGWSIT